MLIGSNTALAQKHVSEVSIDCFGEVMKYEFEKPVIVDTRHPATEEDIIAYCKGLSEQPLDNLIGKLKLFSEKNNLDNWLYYQL
ncbi:MAG TPA: hypothetical protein VFX73_02355, partial [Chitinophagaceae bacterium]|nr:hypothetical protein [Chitinophagaceae bacterium]